MECSVPVDWRDVSDIRQVPVSTERMNRDSDHLRLDIDDSRQLTWNRSLVCFEQDHQECWQGPNGEVLVVEILDRESSVSDDGAAEYFFKDLAEANGIVSNKGIQFVASLSDMPATPPSSQAVIRGGIGRQLVAQGRDTDIAGNPRQLEAKWVRIDLCVIRLPSVTTELLITLTTPGEAAQASIENLDDTFVVILRSFRIVDWGLFGGE